ncbi:SGNH/GDSL hydrolase family protein [Pseudoduganella sp. LjRoot289]|uniref:SGNH/GDSL hydrolase family protein n=1 Tax=Pseudoduganella sp. LjRoot289 TaxID=3342314 RepID=UPI003ED00D16
MRHTKLALSAMAAIVIAGCGGGDPRPGDQTPKVKFASQVSFGDSLSDVGTYAVGGVKAMGGGLFNINGNNTSINAALTGKNWTELVAAQLGLPAPCAALTGLDGVAAAGFAVPTQAHAGCYGYAQGGSRVSNPVGIGNKATGSALGALTMPAVTQVKNHLAAVGGKFKGDEVVFLWSGSNDILFGLDELAAKATAAGTAAGGTVFVTSLAAQLAVGTANPATAVQSIGLAMGTEAARPGHTDTSIVTAGVTAAAQAGNLAATSQAVYGPMVLKAQADATAAGTKAGTDYAAAHGPELVADLGKAGAELVALVKNQIVANGANYVVVVNLPDVSVTPAALPKDAATRALIQAMAKSFNAQLASGLAGESKVALVDAYYISQDEAAHPENYGYTNMKETACDLAKSPLGNSLSCNASTLRAGDVSHYAFADTVHPTPFHYQLIAKYVAEQMLLKGWL